LGERLLPTRKCCDDLQFRDDDEAAAYAIQHLTDRYGRVTQVLERLFVTGHLPLRRRRLSVLEVGSGPAPGLYAVRDFYADLAMWRTFVQRQPAFTPVTVMHALDRGAAWSHFLGVLSGQLAEMRWDLPGPTGTMPAGVEYDNLTGFSTHRKHVEALERAADAIVVNEFDPSGEFISDSMARRFAEADGVDKPSAYDLVVICNFLTTRDSVDIFRRELLRLAFSLTPGGLLVFIGHPHGRKYDDIWLGLQALMRRTGLSELTGYAEELPANPDQAWAVPIRKQRQEILDELRLAGVSLPDEITRLQETDPFPPFRAVVWKNQRPAR